MASLSSLALLLFVTTAVSAQTCVDQDATIASLASSMGQSVSGCRDLAAYCTNAMYKSTLTQYCPVTCKVCGDSSSTGATSTVPPTPLGCADNSALVATAAAMMQLSPTTTCADIKSFCNNAAYATLMTAACPATCGRCRPTGSTTRRTTEPAPSTTTGELPTPAPYEACDGDMPESQLRMVMSLNGQATITSCAGHADQCATNILFSGLCCETCAGVMPDFPTGFPTGGFPGGGGSSGCADMMPGCGAMVSMCGMVATFCAETCGTCPTGGGSGGDSCVNNDAPLAVMRYWGLGSIASCSPLHVGWCNDARVGYLFHEACCELCQYEPLPQTFSVYQLSPLSCVDLDYALAGYRPGAGSCASLLSECVSDPAVAALCPKTCRRCGDVTSASSAATASGYDPSSSGDASSSKSSTGAIVGIAVGVTLAALLLLAIVVVLVLVSAGRRARNHGQTELTVAPNTQFANPAYAGNRTINAAAPMDYRTQSPPNYYTANGPAPQQAYYSVSAQNEPSFPPYSQPQQPTYSYASAPTYAFASGTAGKNAMA